MPRSHTFGFRLCFNLVVLLATLAIAPCTPAQTSGPDDLSKNRLRLLLQSLGWQRSPNAPVLDVAATGSIAYYGQDGSVSSTVRVAIKYRGAKHFRIDVTTASGTATTIANDLGGAHIRPDGTTTSLSSSAVAARSPTFPFLLDSLDLNNPQISVADAALANGGSQRLRVSLAPGDDVASRMRSRASNLVLWLNAENPPPRIDFVRLAADNQYATIPFSLLLSDYRTVDGMAVAFRQEEQVQGRTIKVLSLDSVLIGPGAGVSDSDFRVSKSIGGGAQ